MNIVFNKKLWILITTLLFAKSIYAQSNAVVTSCFLEAKQAAFAGNTKKAISLFNECLEKNPTHAASMFELSQIYVSKGDFRKAEDFAKNAVEIEPNNKWYKKLLVHIYAQEGKNKEYLTLNDQLVKKDPDDPEYIYNQANTHLINNDLNNALKLYNQLEEIVGINEEISIQKYKIYVHLKKYDAAVKEIDNLIEKEPDTQNKYLAVVAEMFMKEGLTDRAELYYEKLLKNSPSDPYINITLADYYRQKNDPQKAITYLKNGFANPKLDPEAKFNIFLNYYNAKALSFSANDISEITDIIVRTHPDYAKGMALKGDHYLDQKKYKEANEYYLKSIALDSTNYKVWERLLNTQAVSGDFASLHINSERAIKIFPDLPTPAFFYAGTLMDQKKYAQAVEIFKKTLPAFERNKSVQAQIYINLAESYYRIGEHQQAFDNYDKALQIEPENSFALNNYAYYLTLQSTNLDKAEQMASKAVMLDPKNAANMDTYGWALYKKQKYTEALEWIKKAIDISKKEDPDVLEHLGDVYYKLGEEKKAVKNWEKALKLYPSSSQLKMKIKNKKTDE